MAACINVLEVNVLVRVNCTCRLAVRTDGLSDENEKESE